MRGTVRMPTPMPAASRLNGAALLKNRTTKSGLITVSAKKPSTTLGMPASTSTIGLRKRRVRGRAYSAR